MSVVDSEPPLEEPIPLELPPEDPNEVLPEESPELPGPLESAAVGSMPVDAGLVVVLPVVGGGIEPVEGPLSLLLTLPVLLLLLLLLPASVSPPGSTAGEHPSARARQPGQIKRFMR